MLRTALLASALVLGLAAQASAETIVYRAKMTGAQEVPPNTSKATGEAEARLDTATGQVSYKVTWKGLTGPATAAHFHGPAKPAAEAGVITPIGGSNPTSPTSGSAKLSEAQVKAFHDGLVYANVHTAAHPGGEIRGQMRPVKP